MTFCRSIRCWENCSSHDRLFLFPLPDLFSGPPPGFPFRSPSPGIAGEGLGERGFSRRQGQRRALSPNPSPSGGGGPEKASPVSREREPEGFYRVNRITS